MRPKDKHLLPCIGHPAPVRFSSGGVHSVSGLSGVGQVQPLFFKPLSSALAAFKAPALSSFKASALAAFILLFSISFLSSGCTKEDTGASHLGSISFSAPTSYINGTETKTSYSGILSGGREGINWVNGDLVRIYSPEAKTQTNYHYSDYVVKLTSSASTSSYKSTATLDPKEGRGNGLWWGTDPQHNFYAIYPSPATTGMSSNVRVLNNTISFTIPDTQTYTASGNTLKPDMNYAYMWAAVKTNTDSKVSLSFQPLFTAFEFTIDSGDKESMILKSFTLSSASTAMCGLCGATITASTNSSASTIDYTNFPTSLTTNRQLTVNFGSITVTKTNPVKVTVFALPRDYSDLTAKWTTSSGQVHSLPLKKNDTFITFLAGRKYKITNMSLPEEWTYSIEYESFGNTTVEWEGGTATAYINLKSTKTRGEVTKSVPVKVQYRTSSSSPWIDGVPEGLTLKASNSGTFSTGQKTLRLSGENISFTAPPIKSEDAEITYDNSNTNALRNATPVSNYDLSLYDVKGGSISRSTANCYIVRAPGTYRFPMVYGNAIKNGSINAAAYTRQQTTATGAEYPQYLFDHLGNPLGQSGSGYSNSVYINQRYSGATTAQLLWEEVEGLISNVNISGNFITFSVPQDKIAQGNALIGVLVGGKIAWSWHIWVTNKSFGTQPAWIFNDGGTNNGRTYWANMELGWVDGDRTITYPKKNYYLRLVQDEPGGKTFTMTLSRDMLSYKNFGALFYNNFRPTPAVSITFNGYRDYYPVGGQYLPEDMPLSGTALSLPQAIQNPNLINKGSGTYMNGYLNLWDTSYYPGYHGYTGGYTPTKTIYDPCPVGYRVPSSYKDKWAYQMSGVVNMYGDGYGKNINTDVRYCAHKDFTNLKFHFLSLQNENTSTSTSSLFKYPWFNHSRSSSKFGSNFSFRYEGVTSGGSYVYLSEWTSSSLGGGIGVIMPVSDN